MCALQKYFNRDMRTKYYKLRRKKLIIPFYGRSHIFPINTYTHVIHHVLLIFRDNITFYK